jgi:hypothetical protein
MTDLTLDELAEAIARSSHETYERYAIAHGWQTQPSTRGRGFDDIPEANRLTMLATFRGLLEAGVIEAGPAVLGEIKEAQR